VTGQNYRIGELARLTGVKSTNIRYFEQESLLPEPARLAGGHRLYDRSHVERLTFIRRYRDFGFTHAQIRELTRLARDDQRSCTEARDLAQAHLVEVRRKMMELQELQRTLEGYIDACDQICLGGPASNCSIFEDLGIARQKSTPIAGCCGAQAKAEARGIFVVDQDIRNHLESRQVQVYFCAVAIATAVALLVPGTTALEAAINRHSRSCCSSRFCRFRWPNLDERSAAYDFRCRCCFQTL
jgi:DNA-binding transcriptional MerR regulator